MTQEQIKVRLETLNKEWSNYAEDCKTNGREARDNYDYETSRRQDDIVSVLGHCRTGILDILKDL